MTSLTNNEERKNIIYYNIYEGKRNIFFHRWNDLLLAALDCFLGVTSARGNEDGSLQLALLSPHSSPYSSPLSQALWRCLLLSHILAPEFLRNGFVSVRGLWSWPRAWLVNCNYSLSPLLSRFVTMQKTHPVYSCLSVPYSLTTTRILVQTRVQ